MSAEVDTYLPAQSPVFHAILPKPRGEMAAGHAGFAPHIGLSPHSGNISAQIDGTPFKTSKSRPLCPMNRPR